MGFRAQAADPSGELRHFFHRAADAQLLEPPQLGDDEVGRADLALVIEDDLHPTVTLQAGERIDGHSPRHHDSPQGSVRRPSNELARQYR